MPNSLLQSLLLMNLTSSAPSHSHFHNAHLFSGMVAPQGEDWLLVWKCDRSGTHGWWFDPRKMSANERKTSRPVAEFHSSIKVTENRLHSLGRYVRKKRSQKQNNPEILFLWLNRATHIQIKTMRATQAYCFCVAREEIIALSPFSGELAGPFLKLSDPHAFPSLSPADSSSFPHIYSL